MPKIAHPTLWWEARPPTTAAGNTACLRTAHLGGVAANKPRVMNEPERSTSNKFVIGSLQGGRHIAKSVERASANNGRIHIGGSRGAGRTEQPSFPVHHKSKAENGQLRLPLNAVLQVSRDRTKQFIAAFKASKPSLGSSGGIAHILPQSIPKSKSEIGVHSLKLNQLLEGVVVGKKDYPLDVQQSSSQAVSGRKPVTATRIGMSTSDKGREDTTAATNTLQKVWSEDILKQQREDTQEGDSRGTTSIGGVSYAMPSQPRIGTAIT